MGSDRASAPTRLGQTLSTVRGKYAEGCKPRLTRKIRGDPPRQTGGAIAVRSTKTTLRMVECQPGVSITPYVITRAIYA
jgi:hypothetical protein